MVAAKMQQYAITASNLTKKYGRNVAVNGISLEVKKGEIFGLVGPDGAGKTTTIQMLCGVKTITSGSASVSGVDVVHRPDRLGGRIGHMTEGFSLYGALTVEENIDYFADLYRVPAELRRERKAQLLDFSRLMKFADRPAEKLSGGMKKKLALCCALIYSPEVVFLDEPTTGVDPVSRRDFWKIIYNFLSAGITVFVSTPYMDEAERCDRVALMREGRILKCDAPQKLKQALSGSLLSITAQPLRAAVSLLRGAYNEVQIFGEDLHLMVSDPASEQSVIRDYLTNNGVVVESVRQTEPSLEDIFVTEIAALSGAASQPKSRTETTGTEREELPSKDDGYAVEVAGLSKRFGDFTAVNEISFRVKKGEIFGFLGPNGSGKSTTIRMLCGLLPPTSGRATVAGFDIDREAKRLRPRIGYMSQKFSLYQDLTAEENIDLYAGIYGLRGGGKKRRKQWVLEMAGLAGREGVRAKDLSSGWKQRLALGCAIMHEPEVLFLDEPTSGVDPVARRRFWDLIYELSAQGVTVFVTTHYMDEAEHCNSIGLIHEGDLIALGSPKTLKEQRLVGELLEVPLTLEELFVALIEAEDKRRGNRRPSS